MQLQTLEGFANVAQCALGIGLLLLHLLDLSLHFGLTRQTLFHLLNGR